MLHVYRLAGLVLSVNLWCILKIPKANSPKYSQSTCFTQHPWTIIRTRSPKTAHAVSRLCLIYANERLLKNNIVFTRSLRQTNNSVQFGVGAMFRMECVIMPCVLPTVTRGAKRSIQAHFNPQPTSSHLLISFKKNMEALWYLRRNLHEHECFLQIVRAAVERLAASERKFETMIFHKYLLFPTWTMPSNIVCSADASRERDITREL